MLLTAINLIMQGLLSPQSLHLPRVYSSSPRSGGNEAIRGAHLHGVWGTEVPVPSGVQEQIPGTGGHEVPQKLKPFCKLLGLHKFWWSREQIETKQEAKLSLGEPTVLSHTFGGHVTSTSSVTWPLDSPYAISC